MPTYDFICEECNFEFEISCSIKDYDKYKVQKCEKCKSIKIRRNYKPPGIKFGAGFFRDGYRSAKDVSVNNDV